MHDYPTPDAQVNSLVELKRVTLRERMEDKKRFLEKQLEDVNNCLALIDEHPEFEKFHNAIARVGY